MKLERIGEWVQWDEDLWIVPATGATIMLFMRGGSYGVRYFMRNEPEEYPALEKQFDTEAEAQEFARAIMGEEK